METTDKPLVASAETKELEDVQKRRRGSVSSSINSSTASVRRRLAFLWRCCVCCFCNVSKCCTCCCCHKRTCCGCCCHEHYHRKNQTDGTGASLGGSIDGLGGGSFEYIDDPSANKSADLPLDKQKKVDDPWSYLVMNCVTSEWQDIATRLGMEKFVNSYPGTVLKERKEVPDNIFSAYDELLRLWSEDPSKNKNSKDFEKFVRELEMLEKSPPNYSVVDASHQETSFCETVPPTPSALSPTDTSKSTLPLDRRLSPTVEKSLFPGSSTPASETQPTSAPQSPLSSSPFVEIPRIHVESPLSEKTPVESSPGKVAEETDMGVGEDAETSEEESSGESDDDDEEQTNTMTKRITRIIRLDPDGNRKEFVYDGTETEDTSKLIEKAIADSPFSQEVKDIENLVKSSTRRVVLKKEVVKRTVIKDGEPEQTVVETSQEFARDGVNVSPDDPDALNLASLLESGIALSQGGVGDSHKNDLAANKLENASSA